MDIRCKNCGGDVEILERSGATVKVKCNCCGSIYEHSTAPKPSHASGIRQSISLEMAGEDIYERNIRSVAEFTTEDGRASGYCIAKRGVFVTNTHAVTKDGAPCRDIRIRVNGKDCKARLIALGDDKGGQGSGPDLALVIAEGGVFDSVTLGDWAGVRNGEAVYYIGNSQGEGTCITGGIVSDRDRVLGGKHLIMTDAATNPGNSGGPLIDKNGTVIGTHVSAHIGAVGMKYAIPVDTVKEFILAVAQKAGVSPSMLCDTSISSRSVSSAGNVLKVFSEGIMYLKR